MGKGLLFGEVLGFNGVSAELRHRKSRLNVKILSVSQM
jgi:hypothetical protein